MYDQNSVHLLFFIFIVSGALMGYSGGQGLNRGILTVKQDSMLELLDTSTVPGPAR